MLSEVTGKNELNVILSKCDLPELEALRLANGDLRNLASSDEVWKKKASEIGCPIEAEGPPGSVRKQVIKYIVDLRQKVNELFIEKLFVPFPKKGIPTIGDVNDFKAAVSTQDLNCLTSILSKKQKIGYYILKEHHVLSEIFAMSARVISGAIIGAIAASRYLYLTPERKVAWANLAIFYCDQLEECNSSKIASLGVAEKAAEMVREDFEVLKDACMVLHGFIITVEVNEIIIREIWPRAVGAKKKIIVALTAILSTTSIVAATLLAAQSRVAGRAEISGALVGATILATAHGILSTYRLALLVLPMPMPNITKTIGFICFVFNPLPEVFVGKMREKISEKTEPIRQRVKSIGRYFFN
ncbi:MAG: hypothetical protein K940chlam6_00731 [Chlamydiae bacterium]|nr:hypothetical protein [Chlamydiota bacterium]